MIEMLNMDCMKYMAGLPDKSFDLAIVDPPYDMSTGKNTYVFKSLKRTGKMDRLDVGKESKVTLNKVDQLYFNEIFRVSKNQIIWGGNYFFGYLKKTSCVLVWDKQNGEVTFADFELAWTSFRTAARIFRKRTEMGNRIHPTQKPVALYKWLLNKYAKPGDKILDTHGGSGSICIACHDLDFDLTWMELDKDYYEAAVKRYKLHASQGRLF